MRSGFVKCFFSFLFIIRCLGQFPRNSTNLGKSIPLSTSGGPLKARAKGFPSYTLLIPCLATKPGSKHHGSKMGKNRSTKQNPSSITQKPFLLLCITSSSVIDFLNHNVPFFSGCTMYLFKIFLVSTFLLYFKIGNELVHCFLFLVMCPKLINK